METYNVLIKQFGDSGESQIRFYRNRVVKGKEKNNLPVDPDVIYQPVPRTEDAIQHSLQTSSNRTKNKIYDYARANAWEWFLTFTFSPDKVCRDDYTAISKAMANWIKSVKRQIAPDLKYLIVPELHSDGKCFHFHGILADCGGLDFAESGHTTQDGETIYNLTSYDLGFTTATKIKDTFRISSYICKYITKDLCAVSKGRQRYWASKNLTLPTRTEMAYTYDRKNAEINEIVDFVQYAKTVTAKYNSMKVYETSVNEKQTFDGTGTLQAGSMAGKRDAGCEDCGTAGQEQTNNL